MAQQKATAEINKFVGGFVTDASPLTFPENTSLVDINMELNTDGSRKRSLGIDYEIGYQNISTGITSATSQTMGHNVYRWENVAGDPEKVILCVQFSNQVKFYDLDNNNISSSLISTINFSGALTTTKFSFTSVDGNLVIANGSNQITTISYDGGVLSSSNSTIKVRDFFGVEDFFDGVDLTTGLGLNKRPSSLTKNHLYNLTNQSFGIPRIDGNNETLVDPINIFRNAHSSVKGTALYPSNSDNVGEFLYADANDGDDRNSKRYFAKDAVKNSLGTSRAPQGYFIIDLLNRGASRIQASLQNSSNFAGTSLNYATSLPEDRTPGGATVVGEFSGRVWYGGFSGEVIDGDSKSPRLSSYITFSQLVTDPSMITQCYQQGDPTSDIEPDIIDTDGGYIRLNNAYGISSLINLGKNLIVAGRNGIWRIFGGNDSGFSATNYVVEKITDKGVFASGSVVQIENTLMYWSDDGIYWLKQNEFGDWISENQTQNRIQKFYNNIELEDKQNCMSVYDSYQRKVRWLYQNSLNRIKQQKELVFDINLNAFYERHISQINGNTVPIVVSGFNNNPFKVEVVVNEVVVSGTSVTSSGNSVEVSNSTRSSEGNLFEIGYVVVTQLLPSLQYTFAAYTNGAWTDWESVDGVGVDAPSTLITGAASGGDNMRFKQIPYLYVHSKRTEDGFELDGNGDFIPTNQSSCTVQSIWDWTNSINSNKWGTPFQAYRYKRVYFPQDINDEFDTGYETIVTKNKLRGRGRAISLKFTSSPKKEMHLYGWSLILSANSNV